MAILISPVLESNKLTALAVFWDFNVWAPAIVTSVPGLLHKVVSFSTINVPPTVALETTFKPVPDVLLNVKVSAISAVLFASKVPSITVAPLISILPLVWVSPVACATSNLVAPLAPIVKSFLTSNVPPSSVWCAPTVRVLFNVVVPAIVVLPLSEATEKFSILVVALTTLNWFLTVRALPLLLPIVVLFLPIETSPVLSVNKLTEVVLSVAFNVWAPPILTLPSVLHKVTSLSIVAVPLITVLPLEDLTVNLSASSESLIAKLPLPVNVLSKVAASFTLREPLTVVVFPGTLKFIEPSLSILMRSPPAVKNFNWSLSAPAVDSALI